MMQNDVYLVLPGKKFLQFKYTIDRRPLYISTEATNQHFIIRNGFKVSLAFEEMKLYGSPSAVCCSVFQLIVLVCKPAPLHHSWITAVQDLFWKMCRLLFGVFMGF